MIFISVKYNKMRQENICDMHKLQLTNITRYITWEFVGQNALYQASFYIFGYCFNGLFDQSGILSFSHYADQRFGS